MKNKLLLCLLALLFSAASFASSVFLLANQKSGPFFIESSKALEADAQMVAINQKIALQDEILKKQEQVFNDSITKLLDTLSVRRGEEEKLIDLMNLESNIFRHKMIDSISTASHDEVNKALESFNEKAKAFSQKNGIGVLFGSGSNFVVYGTGTKADVTNKLVEFLGREHE
jgi:Skp family chaperone for outer membrane proteins